MEFMLEYTSTNNTFSIVARCSKTLALGVAAASASIAVGSAVPHIKSNVGVIAVQGLTNFFHGINGLKLLRRGLSPQNVLEILLKDDPKREMRQISIIDFHGRKAAFTGMKTLDYSGHLIHEDCIVAGNALVSHIVLEAMVESFLDSEGEWLAERLMKSLEAGQKEGGDIRGTLSAALMAAEKKPLHESRPIINLRVDLHKEPIKELRRIFNVYKNWLQMIR